MDEREHGHDLQKVYNDIKSAMANIIIEEEAEALHDLAGCLRLIEKYL